MADETFDAVIVGSGFGGSVMAYRLATAGLRVLVLERGRAHPPGSFPRSPIAMRDNFWDPPSGRQGLFDVWSFRGLDALVASGLGGGSLIYSNVLLRKDERWFAQRDDAGAWRPWPVTRADLDPHYDAVERILAPSPYPFAHAPYSDTPKTHALRDAARELGLEWSLPPLAIAFANEGHPPRPGEPLVDRPGHNMFGAPRTTCRLCGECVVGCNYGSKHTLDLNYLSLATAAGAQVRTRSDVRTLARTDDNDYRVGYLDRASGATHHVRGRFAVMAAGALGTPFLLLRMRRAGALADVSDALGTRFSGNGDLLAFITRAHQLRDGRRSPRVTDPTRGPVITSTIRVADTRDGSGGPGYYVQEAGYPNFVAWTAEASRWPRSVLRALRLARRYAAGLLRLADGTNIGAHIADALGRGELSGTSLPLLIMGRDTPSGSMSVRDDVLDIDWRLKSSESYFDRVRTMARAIAGALDADYHDNPLWRLRRVITVHPLGGAPMGNDRTDGVVDSHGQVYGYPGLYVADGSVMPGPVGPNPALTIAALADRFADHLLAQA